MPESNILPLQVPSTTKLSVSDQMHAATRRAVEIKRQIVNNDVETARLKSELEKLVQHQMPDLFAQLGTTVWETDGIPVKLTTKVKGTIRNAPDEARAVDYLRANDFDGAIQTKLSIDFPDADRAIAVATAKALAESLNRDVGVAIDVNASSLAAWARARLAGGEPVELKTVGLSAWREAALTVK
jgi:hypothetical protein